MMEQQNLNKGLEGYTLKELTDEEKDKLMVGVNYSCELGEI